MKDRDGDQSSEQSKRSRGHLKKPKISTNLYAKSCWPKVMISRDDRICKRTNQSPKTASLTFLGGSSSHIKTGEQEEAIEHLCCKENSTNFDDEEGVCLISSSSEIPGDLIIHKASIEDEENPKKHEDFIREGRIHCSAIEGEIREDGDRERPIFVDLTADEKNTWKQTMLKSFCSMENLTNVNEEVAGSENCSTNVIPEPRIMLADSSNKLHCTGSGSLTTALRDRGARLIPVQPNRSLPIRPAPLVPTRSFRKDCSSLTILSKPTTLDVVEVESAKSINEETPKEKNRNLKDQEPYMRSCCSVEYIVPQISNVGSLSRIKRKSTDDLEIEMDGSKENRKKGKSQEPDSSQNKADCIESSIKEFLKNFCGSNETGGTQNTCTDQCARIVSSTKKENNKLVPPLRLKKVVRTEMESYRNSQVTKETGPESNYRIITGTTPGPSSSSATTDWNERIYGKNTNPLFNSSSLDNFKLKYRRNRLKQKLRELRRKALEMAKQISDDSNSQQNTKLRQAMNRYEKQIENLTKLHGKLSAALLMSSEVVDVNDDAETRTELGYLFGDVHNANKETVKSNSSGSSPEPPKLSPRLPVSFENILPEDVRNSPPILPRVCIAILSSQDPVDENLQVSQRNVWAVNEDTRNSMLQEDNTAKEASKDLQECLPTSILKQQSAMNIDIEDSDVVVGRKSLHRSKTKQEKNNDIEGFSSEHLVVQGSEKIACVKFSESGPVISSVVSGVDVANAVRCDEIFESNAEEQIPSPGDHVLQTTFGKVNEDARNLQKVSSNSNQVSQIGPMGPSPNREHLTNEILQHDCKGETSNDANQRPSRISEQFPSLGNWLTRISKKQAPNSKSKPQPIVNGHFGTTENVHVPGCEVQKMMTQNTANTMLNATQQCSTDRWQYSHLQQQQRQQQLLQHVAASVTLSQPVPTASQLRPAICGPIPMSQFYPNNYTIDPYNGYSAIWPYGTYPYHSRLHPAYHFPMQESLRSLQHERFPPVQESIMRYPVPPPNNLNIRSNTTGNNVGPGSLPSLLLPPPPLSSAQQAIPRPHLTGYPTNSQYSQNRMFPDVVAAAAAAAVVAAASFGRQRDTIPALPTAGIANIINGDSAHVSEPSKVINRDVASQGQDTTFAECHENGTKYQHVQNFLFDRLALVKTPVSVIGGDSQGQYRTSLVDNHGQTSNSASNEFRNFETPHLGKVSHNLNGLYKLACSNCGVLGPKFKCLGCEMVLYCNELCQERHWNVHVQKCPKKMPKLKKVT